MDVPERDFQDLLASLDPISQGLYAEVTVGLETEEFVRSGVGKALVGMAKQDYVEALIAYGECPWWQPRRARAKQERLFAARAILSYLNELIIRGRQAQSTLREED